MLFRRFGDVGTNQYIGQSALTQVKHYSTLRPPMYITDNPYTYWQPTLAVNQITDKAVILGVQFQPSAIVAPNAESDVKTLLPSMHQIVPSNNESPVTSQSFDVGADPALDPTILLSQQHASPGNFVVVNTTISNILCSLAYNLTVSLFAGDNLSSTLLEEILDMRIIGIQ